MKITFISDTHGQHQSLTTLTGDTIIHAGDVSSKGTLYEIKAFLNWFKDLDFKYKIFIAGNHDFFFEQASEYELEKLMPKNIIYLNDSGVTIDNMRIWGSPIQPLFHDWAFNRNRGKEIRKHWDLIPDKTDILVTHGPPMNILDQTITNENVGCADLLDTILRVKPKIHAFGHIHESYGIKNYMGTKFINASVLDVKYQIVNAPVKIEI